VYTLRYMKREINSDDILESRREVAQRIGCSTKTIQRAERRGELNPVRLNSRLIRYRVSDVREWIARSQNPPRT